MFVYLYYTNLTIKREIGALKTSWFDRKFILLANVVEVPGINLLSVLINIRLALFMLYYCTGQQKQLRT